MALRNSWSGLDDDDILVIGRYLLAINALDVAMEDAIMRHWKIDDRMRFREVFFRQTSTGEKHRLLQESLNDSTHKKRFKTIKTAIELRNVIAHKLPVTEWLSDRDDEGEILDHWPVARIGPVPNKPDGKSFGELASEIADVEASRAWVNGLHHEPSVFTIEIPPEDTDT
jgi:hypothetical protein